MTQARPAQDTCRPDQVQDPRPDQANGEIAVWYNAYGLTGLKAPNTAREWHAPKFFANSDIKPLMCLISKCATTRMGITRHNLLSTKVTLMVANSSQIKLDGIFLTLTLGDATSSQLVYVTCLIHSQIACQSCHQAHGRPTPSGRD